MTTANNAAPIWHPSKNKIDHANVTALINLINKKWGAKLFNYNDLHHFSINEMEKFWVSFWDFSGVIAETRGDVVLANKDKMPGAEWFPEARLNYAQNLLRRRGDADAMVFWGEDRVTRKLSCDDLYNQVSAVKQALEKAGVVSGTRVVGYLPNMPEAIIAMLATTSIGAIWSSCSPDFGIQGVLDRFGQIKPKVIFAVDGYFYNGKEHDCLEKLSAIIDGLPTVEKIVVVEYRNADPEITSIRDSISWNNFSKDFVPKNITFAQLPFSHPLFIMYSSGTTGAPKCIVHGHGGSLFQLTKEHLLQADVKPGDRYAYFTTCGWMMWNWLTAVLACEATLLLYDGSPFYPDGNRLFDFVDAEDITHFGTSAKFINAVSKAGLKPKETHKLKSLKAVLSTGSPLVAESYNFVYEHIKEDLHLASVSGGTDIMGCFVSGNPTGPVWRGEIQVPSLGMACDVFDADGNAMASGKGDLVCKAPFPSLPVSFWNDTDGSVYRKAYFVQFPNIWRQGDYAEWTSHGGMTIYGRSDATLNPGGVRIGTAEIYRQVESLDDVIEGIVVGQEWDDDTRIVLFVVLRPEKKLDTALIEKIKNQIRANCTPRHVPRKVIQVADIPRTRSGKITELAVRDIIHGREITNREALANPEALDLYKDIEELQN
jgi:acetoacetyl-CoA synthetase